MDSADAELGLEGQNGADDLEAFDAFNDDTFGAGADTWDEEGHEELAKITEEEIHGFNAGNEFFELDKDASGLDDCLEAPDTSTINGDQDLSQKMTNLSMIPPPPKPNISPDFVDPAIMSMGSMPLPPSRPPMFPAPNAGPMTVEELERQMMAQQHQGLQQQQLRHQQMQQEREEHERMRHMQQQQQHQQQLMMQQQEQQQMLMRAQMQHQQYLRQQQQMVEQQRQQMMHNQRQQQQQSHGGFQSRQQQLHQQFHQGRRQDYDNYNKGRGRFNNRNPRDHREQQQIYDDKDRETFGDDFVNDHQREQVNPLIMPGHVHTQNILRGARGGGSGRSVQVNPMEFIMRQQQQQQQHQHHHRESREGEDDFAGLMSQRERQWVINIQLNQLKDENDYYFTVSNQKKKALAEGIDLKKGRRFFFGEEEDSDEEGQSRMFKRDDETVLLLKSESMSMDSPKDEYTPQQYENSLGKLQAVTVKAPRKIIDVMGVLNQDAEQLSNAQKDSRNFKKTLLELEKLYNTLIDVEDCEKKLAVLPTGTPLRSQVETDGKEGIRYLGQQLVREDKLRLYITVRKGKALLIRALRWLNASQLRVVCATLFSNYPLAVKKDRDDKLLKDLWMAGIKRHVAHCSALGLLHFYFTLLWSDQVQAKSGSILKHIITTPLGMSFLLSMIYKLALLHQQQPNADTTKSRNLLINLGKKLSEECTTEISAPLNPINVELPHFLKDENEHPESVQQLQKIINAGISE